MIVLLVLLFAAFAGVMYGLSAQEDALVAVSRDASNADGKAAVPAQERIVVYVTGGVRDPGVYEMASGSRVEALVRAAGGALETADLENINLAQSLKDGMQVRVPECIQERAPGAGDDAKGTGTHEDGRVNINTADEKQLDALPGIGPAMAQRILEYRRENGSFQSAEDLKKVRGIGDAKFEKLKDKVKL